MIAISEHLIRSARRYSVDGDSPMLEGSSKVEDLMSHSPPNLPHINQATAAPSEAALATKGESKQQKEQQPTAQKKQVTAPPSRVSTSSSSSKSVCSLVFAKDPVERKQSKQASSLSKELQLGGIAKSSRSGGRGGGRPVKVLVGDGPFFKVGVRKSATVEDVIMLIINEYTRLKRQPSLLPDPDMYELLMVDDDEPDDSLPPLAANKNFASLQIDEVALCPKDGAMILAAPKSRPARGPSLAFNSGRLPISGGRYFLKV